MRPKGFVRKSTNCFSDPDDGILALYEIFHEVRIHRHRCVFLKLVFQKNYDRLDQAFLHLVLEWRRFDDL